MLPARWTLGSKLGTHVVTASVSGVDSDTTSAQATVALIPHYIVLFFLHIAACVCVSIAWFAILFTGRGLCVSAHDRPLSAVQPRGVIARAF